MAIKGPMIEELAELARRLNLRLTMADLESFRRLMEPTIAAYSRLDELVEPMPAVKYARTVGYRPESGENPLGAWYWRCDVKGASEGPLKGKTFAIKDNIAVAGIPMMDGTKVLEGYMPLADATVVTRILDAGGTILGKSVCESLCMSGGSHTSDTGPVRNPHDRTRSTGGSSSGSGALVAAGEVDMAIGGDQGGSIRTPSSWCGIYGLKPTWGLVPYTGAIPLELTLDHLGPMARSASDCALLLEVIAGPDGLDPRQRPDLVAQPYTKALSGDAKGPRFAIVKEGFGWARLSETDVDERVTNAARGFEKVGGQVSEISIPWHREGVALFSAIVVEGGTAMMIGGNGLGVNWKGYYATNLLDAFARGLRTRADDLSEMTKLVALTGLFMHERYHGRYYAKAQNLARSLRAAYDAALRDADLLVMPTTAQKATPIPPPGCSREEHVDAATNTRFANTASFDVSGHPAINVPCGMSQGLPVGMMLVGRVGDDALVLRAADAWQREFGS